MHLTNTNKDLRHNFSYRNITVYLTASAVSPKVLLQYAKHEQMWRKRSPKVLKFSHERQHQ